MCRQGVDLCRELHDTQDQDLRELARRLYEEGRRLGALRVEEPTLSDLKRAYQPYGRHDWHGMDPARAVDSSTASVQRRPDPPDAIEDRVRLVEEHGGERKEPSSRRVLDARSQQLIGMQSGAPADTKIPVVVERRRLPGR